MGSLDFTKKPNLSADSQDPRAITRAVYGFRHPEPEAISRAARTFIEMQIGPVGHVVDY